MRIIKVPRKRSSGTHLEKSGLLVEIKLDSGHLLLLLETEIAREGGWENDRSLRRQDFGLYASPGPGATTNLTYTKKISLDCLKSA